MLRRELLKWFSMAPFARISTMKPQDKIKRIANYIEKHFVNALHKKNPIISSLDGVRIFYDDWLSELRNKTCFYGFVTIQLDRIDFWDEHLESLNLYCNLQINKEQYEKLINYFEFEMSRNYGYSVELKEKLSLKEIELVIEELLKRSNSKEHIEHRTQIMNKVKKCKEKLFKKEITNVSRRCKYND